MENEIQVSFISTQFHMHLDYYDAVVQWLSLLHNFIQLSLNSGSAQVQTLLAACWRFAMVRISDNGPDWNKSIRPSSVNHTTKISGAIEIN